VNLRILKRRTEMLDAVYAGLYHSMVFFEGFFQFYGSCCVWILLLGA